MQMETSMQANGQTEVCVRVCVCIVFSKTTK